MAETSFGVRYVGPAVEDGHMPVRDLAPALLALGEVFTEASLSLYPKQDPVSLEIEAAKDGSFMVDLLLQGGHFGWDQISTFANSDTATTLVLLKGFVIGGAADPSLFGLIQWLKGRQAKEEPAISPGHIRYTTADGDSLEVPAEVASLHKNFRVRRRVQKVVEPVGRRGVEAVEFRTDSETMFSLSESELPSFELPVTADAPLLDEELELYLEVVSPTFKDDNKWRLSDGEKVFWAEVLDDDFWHEIDMGRSFAKGDKLHCRLQLIQTQDENGRLHTHRRVMRVLKILPAPTQIRMESGDPPKELPPA